MFAINRLKQDHPKDLRDTMTVQEVKCRYPGTRAIFEDLLLNRHFRFEGYDCLDEVAWHHGMESRELFALLRTGPVQGALCQFASA